MTRQLGRGLRNKKEVPVKTEAPWRKERSDLQKHLTDKMNKVSGRKAVPLAEDEKKLKKKTMRPNGNVWRI